MSRASYHAKKARGVCANCGLPHGGRSARCEVCLERHRIAQCIGRARGAPGTQRALMRAWTQARPIRVHPLLACCGEWHPIAALPFRTPCCHRIFFA